jgi:hypothetical protein
MTREGREILIAARVQELKMYGRLASAIYEVVESELRKQLQERQLAANPRKDDR